MVSKAKKAKRVHIVLVDAELCDQDSDLKLLEKRFGANLECYASLVKFKQKFVPNGKPTCILIDEAIGSGCGISLLASMKEDGLTQPVIMMSSDYSVRTVVRAMKAGAFDFIEKPFDSKQLQTVVKSVLDSCPPELNVDKPAPVKHEASAAGNGASVDELVQSLPRRKGQTLKQLLSGDSEKQIAYKLEISPHTVHDYVKWLYKEFDVSSRGELLAKCLTA